MTGSAFKLTKVLKYRNHMYYLFNGHFKAILILPKDYIAGILQQYHRYLK